MRLVVHSKGSRVSEVQCEHEAVYIGSDESCGLVLADSRVPPRHAVVYPEGDDGWVLQPLDESDSLHLNGVGVTEKVQLRNNDQITVHEFMIRAVVEDTAHRPVRGPAHQSVAQMTRFVQAQLPQGSLLKKSDEPITILPAQVLRMGKVNVALGACNMVEELMNITLQVVLETFGAQRAWMGIRRVNYGTMEYVEGRTLLGQTFDLPEVGETLKVRALDRAQFVLVPQIAAGERISAMIGPILGPDGPLGMIYIDTGDTGRHFESVELDLFIAMMNLIGAQLDAIFKSMAKTRAATLDGEVVVAHAIQGRLTPRKLPQWEGLQFGAFREPGREKSSDVYDIVKLANQAAGIMIAHSHATGPLPSMVMSQAQAAFRTAVMHNDAPHIFMRSLNVLLYDGQGDRAIDCLMAIIDPESGQMRYAMAGKIGAYIIGGRGEERKLPDQGLPPCGLERAVAYNTLAEQLDSSETTVLFTPGVITARNSKGDAFGEERFINILCDGFGQLASTMLKEMLSDLQHFTEGGQQPEDITVILAHKV
jgi:serine phosphatase RsbU (regulator of sigma subunit)